MHVQQPKNDFFFYTFFLHCNNILARAACRQFIYSIKYPCTAYIVLIIEHVLKLLVIFYYTNNITVIISFTQNHCGNTPHSLLIFYKYHYITTLCAAVRPLWQWHDVNALYTKHKQKMSCIQYTTHITTTTNSFIQRYNRKLIGINVYFNLLPICAICC